MLTQEAIVEKRKCGYVVAAGLLARKEQKKLEQEQQEERTLGRKSTARPVSARDWLAIRHVYGQFNQFLTVLHREDPKGYRNYMIITPDQFKVMVVKLTFT